MADAPITNTDSNPPRENEIAEYYEGVKKMELSGYERGIKNARNALFVVAALVFIGELVFAGISGTGITAWVIGIAIAEAAVFIALGLWTKTKPFTAIVIGLIIFILMWVASIVIIGNSAIYKGIIVKIIIIFYLISALKPAKAWEETKKTM